MPLIQNVYRDKLLTNVSVKYTNSNFIANQVAPVLEVDLRTGFYFVYDKSNLRRPPSTKRTGLSKTNVVEHNLTQAPYGPLTERKLKEAVTQDDYTQSDQAIDPESDAVENITENMLMERELDLVADLTNTSIVTQYTTLSGTSQWSDYTNSDPLVALQGRISAMKLAGLITPNVFVMGQQVWDQLKNHPKVVDRIKYTSSDSVAMETIARLIGVQACWVGDAGVNVGYEGLADSMSFIWGKHAWLMYVAPKPGLKRLSAFYHLTLSSKGAKNSNVYKGVDKWYENDPPITWCRVNDYYDRKLVATEAVYGIFNAVA